MKKHRMSQASGFLLGFLASLLSLQVMALDLDYKTSKRTDENGNVFRYGWRYGERASCLASRVILAADPKARSS